MSATHDREMNPQELVGPAKFLRDFLKCNGESNPQEMARNSQFLHAYMECTDQIQQGVMEMLDILYDGESTDDERHMALVTLADALYPNFHKGQLGMDLEESERETPEHVPALGPILEMLDREEAEFAQRLKHLMVARNINQAQLADKIGVGQPAISNMLNRQCRPQRRTIERLAAALGVQPSELWTSSGPSNDGSLEA